MRDNAQQTVVSRRTFLGATMALASVPVVGRVRALAAYQSEFESRAILDEGLNWATRNAAQTVCKRIKRAGFNVFIPCVWHGRGTIWPSDLAPWDSHHKRQPGFDPLDNLLRTAAAYEIEVHPWFTVALRQREFLPEFFDEGTPANTFDIHRDAFRAFMTSLIGEVVERYRVHGINLDFVRAGGVCRSSQCATDYRTRTGRDLTADSMRRRIPGADLTALARWQEEAVGDLVRRVSERVRRQDPEIVVSVDAAPDNPIVLLEGQDSIRWADTGWIDVIFNMQYQSAPDFGRIQSLRSRMVRPGAMVVLCGNFDRVGVKEEVVPRKAGLVSELLRAAREDSDNGVGLYLYSMLSNEQIDHLHKTVFQVRARPRWVRAQPA
jgi:uncharacterized lipoprotein YddW (UPF0748 family)